VKNTHEILGPLHAATAHQRLTSFEFLTPDRTLRRATYGNGVNRTVTVVNFGAGDKEVATRYQVPALPDAGAWRRYRRRMQDTLRHLLGVDAILPFSPAAVPTFARNEEKTPVNKDVFRTIGNSEGLTVTEDP
jgi:hypothetical protein